MNCARCGKAFESKRSWQNYCSSTCRVASQRRRTVYSPDRRKAYGAGYIRLRAMVLEASDVCGFCGYGGATSVDHIIPIAHGGESTLDNLRPAHSKCNSAAGGRLSVPTNKGERATNAANMPRARMSRWG